MASLLIFPLWLFATTVLLSQTRGFGFTLTGNCTIKQIQVGHCGESNGDLQKDMSMS